MTTDPTAHDHAVAGLENAFTELLAQFRRVYAQAAETVVPGMLPATYKVLSVIERVGPITVSGLAEHLAADKGQMSRSVTELEEHGLVERTTDPADGRVRLIVATPLGRERAAAARLPYQRRLRAVLGEWPVDQVTQLTELLQALTSGTSPRD